MSTRRPWPLARGIAVGITVLTAAVLVLAGVIVTAALRTFLLDRLDQQATALLAEAGGLSREAAGERPSLPAGAVVVTTAPGGAEVTVSRGSGAPDVSAAALPAVLRPTTTHPAVDATFGGLQYRVVAGSVGDSDDNVARAVVALPLRPVEETLERLVVIELAVGALALLLVAVGGYAVARSRLRPLARISTAARDIAGTDLLAESASELRLPDLGGSAEVVDLTGSLNAMLGHIDAALSARAEAEARLRRFVADASHELRTPLASIRGYAELTRRRMAADAEATALAAGRIETEATRMGVLVDDLLLLARLDQGRPLTLGDVDLGDLARRCAEDARVGGDGHRIDVDVPDTPLLVRGDRDRLQQVVVNLLSNAVSHTPPGTPVTVSVRRVAGRARLVVADRGPGIPPDDQEKVFEPFYRVDAGRSRDRGGSGLGLSIVASIVAAHGGDVVLDSGPAGTTVTVELPDDADAARVSRAARPATTSPAAPSAPRPTP